MTAPINLTQLRHWWQDRNEDETPDGWRMVHHTTMLALIDTAEAALAFMNTYTLTGGGYLEADRLRETLARYTT